MDDAFETVAKLFQGREFDFIVDIMRDWARNVPIDRLILGQRSTQAYIAEREPQESRHAHVRLAIINEELARRTATILKGLEGQFGE